MFTLIRAKNCSTRGCFDLCFIFFLRIVRMSNSTEGTEYQNGSNGSLANDRHEEHQYLDQIRHIIDKGTRKEDRTGVGTISVFGTQARYSLKDGMYKDTTP